MSSFRFAIVVLWSSKWFFPRQCNMTTNFACTHAVSSKKFAYNHYGSCRVICVNIFSFIYLLHFSSIGKKHWKVGWCGMARNEKSLFFCFHCYQNLHSKWVSSCNPEKMCDRCNTCEASWEMSHTLHLVGMMCCLLNNHTASSHPLNISGWWKRKEKEIEIYQMAKRTKCYENFIWKWVGCCLLVLYARATFFRLRKWM